MQLPDPALEPEFYSDLLLKRFVAWVIDLLITLVLVALALVLSAFIGLFFFPLLYISVSIAYRWVMLSNYGATAGMMLCAIKLRHLDGQRPQSTVCFWHAAIFSASMATVVGQILSLGLMLTTPYRQGLNDVILRTAMINRYLED